MFHNNTFEPGGVKTEGKIPSRSKRDSLGFEIHDGLVHVQEGAQARAML